MAISRSQMAKQVDGKLRGAKDEKKKKKEEKVFVKKSNKKSALSRTFTV